MRLLALTGAVLLSCASLAPAAWALTGEETKLLRGETVLKDIKIDGLNGIEASFFAKAPPEVAYRVMADVDQLAAFMPSLKECVVLQRGDGYAVIKQIGEGGELTQRRSLYPPDEIRWTLIQSPMLRQMKGYWRMKPLEEGTVLSYGLAVEPKVPLPSNVVVHFQQQKIPPLVENVRARIESRGKWTKPEFGR
ncbi:Polyketide cyclase / dehydrase and lipid transport [compost metagenome]